MRFLGMSGSLRAQSTNTALLRAFARQAPDTITVEIFEHMGALPLFNPDLEAQTPDSVLMLAEKIAAGDGLLIASPEYAHGISGVLKNALDWMVSRFEIPGKPVMLVHASQRGRYVREHLGEVLTTMSCRLFDGPPYEIHLVGKSPAMVNELLDAAETSTAMRATLSRFAAFVAAPA